MSNLSSPASGLKLFTVGVFKFHEDPKRKPRYSAYTRWFDPSWAGCCVHRITAESGAQAKREAIGFHKLNCEATNVR